VQAACIIKTSCDDATRVDGIGECECGARRVERGEGAVRGAHETVIHEVCFQVVSRDDACRVDDEGLGSKRAREIGGREGAVGSPQEAVLHEACVKIDSRDGPGGSRASRHLRRRKIR
jgi:hypothetical protein